jgi:hypothetical protein
MSQWLAQKRIVIIGETTGLGCQRQEHLSGKGRRSLSWGEMPRMAEAQLDGKGIALQGGATNPTTAPAAIGRCQTALCPEQHSY